MKKQIALACLLATGTAWASDSPALKNTNFFTKTATGCKDVNMSEWHHPIRQVFIERGIKLQKVSLCNNNKFPVFYFEAKYDPHLSHNNNYFHPLYRALLKDNAHWPFAIVDTSDNAIIVVSGKGNVVNEDIEDYTE